MIYKKVKFRDRDNQREMKECWVVLSEDLKYLLGWGLNYKPAYIYPSPVEIISNKLGFKYPYITSIDFYYWA